MASNKLLIQIALEGGKEIERQLEGLGEAGVKAFGVITQAAEQAGGFKNLNLKEVQTELEKTGVIGTDAINKIVGAVKQAGRLETLVGGIQNVQSAFTGIHQAVKLFSQIFGPLAAAIGLVTAQFEKTVSAAIDTAKAVGAINAEAIKLGIGIEQLDRLRLGFEKAGFSATEVSAAISGFAGELEKAKLEQVTENLQQLADGAGDSSKAMRELREMANGIGPAADAASEGLRRLKINVPEAKTALEKLGVVVKSTGNVLTILNPDPVVTKFKSLEEGAVKAAETLQKMSDGLERTKLAMQAFRGASAAMVQALATGRITVDQFVTSLKPLGAEAAFNALKLTQSLNAAATAWERLRDTGGSPLLIALLDAATAALQRMQQAMAEEQRQSAENAARYQSAIRMLLDTIGLGPEYWARFGEAAKQAVDDSLAQISQLVSAITSLVTTPVADAWQWIVDSFNAVVDAVVQQAQAIADSIRQLFSSASGGGGGAPAPAGQGHARGGLLGGRGSGMSDSNLAWVSRGEHIMPARAVAQPGVLAFLEALRRSGGNLSRVLDGIGRFAMGGLVPSMPGGLNGMSNVTIQFPGLPAIGGLRASADVVAELQKAAAMAQVRSGGRKPSRYR